MSFFAGFGKATIRRHFFENSWFITLTFDSFSCVFQCSYHVFLLLYLALSLAYFSVSAIPVAYSRLFACFMEDNILSHGLILQYERYIPPSVYC